MPRAGFTPEVQEEFRGEFTLPGNAQSVPAPYSPSCTNVQFFPGRVQSRPGLTTLATYTAATILSLKEYVTLDTSARRILALTSDGVLSKETGTYTFSSVTSNIVESSANAALQMNSVTQFGREYMAFATNGVSGAAVPLVYDDTNVDRVAPSGPACTPVLATAATGVITAGTHQVRVLFITRNGYYTPPGPASTATTFDGTQKASVTGITTGPPWVTGRIVCMTPNCNTTDFYFVPGTGMVLNDNTSTTTTFSVADNDLLAAEAVTTPSVTQQEDSLRLIELPPQTTGFAYHGRLAWVGERNEVVRNGDIGFLNLSFDGGFTGNRPYGWTELVSGEAKGTAAAGTVGDYLRLVGNGVGVQGVLQNEGVAQSALASIPPGTQINCRVRARRVGTAGGGGGKAFVYLCPSATANGTIPNDAFTITASALSTTEWRIIDASMLTAANNVMDSTYRLRCHVNSGVPNLDEIQIDYISIYPAAKAKAGSLVRWSKANEPDAYDGLYGIQTIAENATQDLTCGFVLGDNAYLVKERSLYVTRDDGANEPNFWPVSQVSSIYGTPSAQGVGIGDQWVVIAGRAGLAFFDGGRPTSLSEDIRPTWNRINWLYGYKIHVRVDPERRRVCVYVPLDSATTCTTAIVLDYYGDSPQQSRNFNRWNITAGTAFLCSASSERSDGTKVQIIGTNDTNGIVAKWDDTVHSDFSSGAISSRYRFAYMGGGTGRNLWGSVTANIWGSGTLNVQAYLPDDSTATTTRTPPAATLAAAPKTDFWWAVDVTSERLSWEVYTNASGAWFSMQKFAPYIKAKPWSGEAGKRGGS